MKGAALGLIALALVGCPDDAKTNPPTLWLYLEGGETDVQLVDYEPPPF